MSLNCINRFCTDVLRHFLAQLFCHPDVGIGITLKSFMTKLFLIWWARRCHARNFFFDMVGKALSGELSCMRTGLVLLLCRSKETSSESESCIE